MGSTKAGARGTTPRSHRLPALPFASIGGWDDIETLEGADLAARLLKAADAAMGAGRAQRHEDPDILASLPEALATVWLLSSLDFEVAQGALDAYFANSSGQHAEQAVAALRRIGADEMAGIVQQAHDVVRRHQSAWTEERRRLGEAQAFDIFESDEDLPGAEELDALTDAYHDAADRDAWGDKLERYLESERSAVARWAAARSGEA